MKSTSFSQTTSEEPTFNFNGSKLIVRIDNQLIKFVFKQDYVKVKSRNHNNSVLKRTLDYDQTVNQVLLFNNDYSVFTIQNSGKTFIAFQTEQQSQFVFKKIALDPKRKKLAFVYEWSGISYNKVYN